MPAIEITFPGGSKVNARFLGFEVPSDQRKAHGGEQTAPNPFDYYFVALATCAGSSALGYCQENQLPTEGLAVQMQTRRHATEPRVAHVTMRITLPEGFPSDHIAALQEAAGDCTVKRHILNPPTFETIVIPRS